jgi:superfamily II DNA or RNA helicase
MFSQFLDNLDIIEDFLDGLGLQHRRLDGTISAAEKQKRIDEFNAPDSPYFAFLLSTRAGGVGINLATADTVILLDPDFNPHQDIQALSRAHRIGQKQKVLVFQLMVRDSVEEKIMQIGRKKMALDHVLIERMDREDDAGEDLESILRHGAQALFESDTGVDDIVYDSASVDRLLDRSQIEDTKTSEQKSAESQFSFARVWANDKATLEEDLAETGTSTPNPGIWDKILQERERSFAEEQARKAEAFGRGKRKRQVSRSSTSSKFRLIRIECRLRRHWRWRRRGQSQGETRTQKS